MKKEMLELEQIKKTSEEWAKDCIFIILDPDGWDRTNYEYSWGEELITAREFNTRLLRSTLTGKNN